MEDMKACEEKLVRDICEVMAVPAAMLEPQKGSIASASANEDETLERIRAFLETGWRPAKRPREGTT